MAFDFDDNGDVSREGKWVLFVFGLIILCCLLTTCSYLLFKLFLKRRRAQQKLKAEEEEAEKWNHRCSLQRIKILQYGDPDSKKTKTEAMSLEERSDMIPTLSGLDILINVSNDQIKEKQRINHLIQSGVTHSGTFTRAMMMAINCETETVTKDKSILNSLKPMQQYLRLYHSGASHVVVSSHLTDAEPTLKESERALSQFVENSEPTDFLLLAILDGDRHTGDPAFELQYTYHLLKALDHGATVIVVEDSHPGKDPPSGITPSSVITAQSNKYSFTEGPQVSDTNFSYITCVGGQHSKFRTGQLMRSVTTVLNDMSVGDTSLKYSELVLKIQREFAREASDGTVAVQFGSTFAFAPNDVFEMIPRRGQSDVVQIDVISVGDMSDGEKSNSPRKEPSSDSTSTQHRASASHDADSSNGSVRRRKNYRQQLPSATNSSASSSSHKRSVRPLRRPPPPRMFKATDGVNPLDDAFSFHQHHETSAGRLPGRDWMLTENTAPTHVLPSSPPVPARNSLPIAPLVQSRFPSNRSWMQS
eukprot:TRINITY_DN11050_c0_g1_i1.p1 TRINITY_DN11050_c0_g1~~TRINITY_DN11050_c0_g1_i1.p1  ORF type:complete len:541 (+),score=100.85 TRINITY_DN11050_c0_g1_i1:26-1624(+)